MLLFVTMVADSDGHQAINLSCGPWAFRTGSVGGSGDPKILDSAFAGMTGE